MKTVCKKLLCLMLVAMMLISAVPFAFAADGESAERTSFKVNIKVYLDGADSGYVKEYTVKEDAPLNFTEDQAMSMLTKDNRAFDKWTNAAGDDMTGDKLTLGWLNANDKEEDSYYVCVYYDVTEPVETEPEETEPEETEPEETEPEETEPEETEPEETEPEETEPEAKTYTLYFHYLNADGVDTVSTKKGVESGDKIKNFPSTPNVEGKRFDHWAIGSKKGEEIEEGEKWYDEMSNDIYAVYTETNDDGVVKLSVWAHYYVEGEYHHKEKLFVENFNKSSDNTMFTWLYGNVGMETTRKAAAEAGYQWEREIFYDYHDDGAVVEADLKTNKDRSVYIKVTSLDEIEASVMLYVHTAKEADVDHVIPMPGYTEGDYVTLAEAKEAVKTKYSGSNISYSDLYTADEWEDLLDGENPTGARSVKVEDNGITKIHIIVKNAKSSSKADSTNPKTGDSIMVAVATMTVSAAALVAVAELKKRKMI